MTLEHGAYRRPYRRGDYHLVDTTRDGTYWQSPDGVVVRMASAESGRATVSKAVAVSTLMYGMLAGSLAR